MSWRRNRTSWRRQVHGACPCCGGMLWRLRRNHVLRCEAWTEARDRHLERVVEVFVTFALITFLLLVQCGG